MERLLLQKRDSKDLFVLELRKHTYQLNQKYDYDQEPFNPGYHEVSTNLLS